MTNLVAGRVLGGVLFDLDDVLVPFHTPAAWQWAWHPQGPLVPERKMRSVLRRSLKLWDRRRWQGLTGALPPADVTALEGHLGTTLGEIAGHALPSEETAAVVRRLLHPTGEVERYPDVMPALQRLRAVGLKLGVATPLPRESASWLLRRVGAGDLEIAGAGDPPGPGVPDKAAFRSAAEHLGVPAKELVYVGDLLWSDVRAAHRAGLVGILLDRTETWPHAQSGRIRTLDELERALASLEEPSVPAGPGPSEPQAPAPDVDPPNVYTAGPGARPVDGGS